MAELNLEGNFMDQEALHNLTVVVQESVAMQSLVGSIYNTAHTHTHTHILYSTGVTWLVYYLLHTQNLSRCNLGSGSGESLVELILNTGTLQILDLSCESVYLL